ncbi:MAG: hypothetical protein IPG50_32115 [Myxococcales bacterium]|nr:hypothetical protein [Myxococcales bacterium]
MADAPTTLDASQLIDAGAPLDAASTSDGDAGPAANAGYDVSARIAAFNARLVAVRVAAGQSATSTFAPLSLPTPPTLTAQLTVSNATEMAAALAMSNVEVTFTGSGFTATLNLSGRHDQRWIFPAGFTLTAPPDGYAIQYGNGSRIELVGTGGRVVGGTFGAPVDLRVRGMDIRTRTDSSQIYLDTHSMEPCSRVLIESSYWFARSYAMLYGQCTDFVVGNSEFVSAGAHATSRTSASDLVLWMDSRLVTQGTQQLFRAHAGTNRFAGWNLRLEGSTGIYIGPAGAAGVNVQDLVLLDNAYYGAGQAIHAPYTSSLGANVTMATVVANRAYTTWTDELTAGPGWIVSNNSVSAPVSAPPWSRQ